MNRKDIPLTCQITYIGEEKTFRRPGRTSFSKRIITLQTEDNQVLHCELRRMYLLDNVDVGNIVDVEISFAGSEKNGKRYNNIFINKMAKK